MKFFLLIILSITGLSQAATFIPINIMTLEIYETDQPNVNALVLDTVNDTITTSYTFMSDYDGQGGLDTLSFDVVATFSGPTNGAEYSTPNNPSDAANYVIYTGHKITFSLTNLIYTRANGFPNNAIFNGFYEISVGGNLEGSYTSTNTGTVEYGPFAGTGNSITFLDSYPSLDLTLSSDVDGFKVFRRPDASFSLETTIPEPRTAALLGVGVLALLSRRHRKSF